MQKRRKRDTRGNRKYTEAERKKILEDVELIGRMSTIQKYDLPASTLRNWLKKPNGGPQSAETSQKKSKAPESKEEEEEQQQQQQQQQRKQKVGRPVDASKASHKSHVSKRYTSSQKKQILEYASEHGVSSASKKYDVSRYSIYEWQRKESLAQKGQGLSPTSGPEPEDIEAQRDMEILNEWRQHVGLGPSQIRNQLRRKGIKVAVQTVRRVMESAGYRPPKVEHRGHERRYESIRPNHLWHLDFVQRYINRVSTFTLILLDDYSRFVVGHGVDKSERADFVIETFDKAVQRYGRPEMIMNDKGSAFWSWKGISRFSALLTELGIDQIIAEHKEWNGKVEVFNGNLHKELFDVHRFYDVSEMKHALKVHLDWYNHKRTHHGLGGLLVPADRYYGRVEEVLAQIEAGDHQTDNDIPGLRDRCLELFKIVSHNGIPQVWLMGKNILTFEK